jgi:hypothetical protein
MAGIIVRALRPIGELDNLSQKPILILTGLPYCGKSTGIKNTPSATVPNIQKIQTYSGIDALRTLTRERVNHRIHFELPKDLTDQDIECWKNELEKFLSSNNNAIIEGRTYVVKSLLSKDDLLPLNQQGNIAKEFFIHLLTLKNTYVERLPVKVFQLDKDDANIYLGLVAPSSRRYNNDILDYSKVTDGHEEAYIPFFLDRAVEIANENHDYKEIFEEVRKNENALSLNREQLRTYFVSQLQSFPVQQAAHIAERISETEAFQSISESASTVIGSVSSALTPVIPIAAIVPIALFILRFANNYRHYTDKKMSVEQLIMFRRAWENLCEERKVIIGYTYDQAMKLVPGTAAKALNSLFLHSESQFKEKIEGIQEQVQSLFDRIDSIEENIQSEIQKIKRELLEEKGLITDISQLGLKYEKPILMCRSGTGPRDETYVEVVISEEYRGVQNEIKGKLNSDNITVLTGSNGIGKSILARHIIYDLLEEGKEIISLDKVPEEKVLDRLGESTDRDRVVFYDPLSPELYLPRKEIQGTEYIGSDIPRITRKIKSLINYGGQALVVLPGDIWRQVESLLSTPLHKYDIQARLRTKDFLKGIIKSYSQECTPLLTELEVFVDRLMQYEAGYTLVASYLGRWLSKSQCVTQDINYALIQAQSEPVRFLQNYVWSVIIGKDYALASRIALPLIAHVYLGDMTVRLAAELPLASHKHNPTQLDPGPAEWIATPHEDLMELALKKIVLGTTNEKNSPELRDMIRAVSNAKIDISIPVSAGEIESANQVLSYVQWWLGDKMNSLSTNDLKGLLEFYSSCMVWAEKETESSNAYLQYFYEEQQTPSAGLKVLLGIPYEVNDLVASLDSEKLNFCEMLADLVKDKISNIGVFGLEILLKALSYVAGASVSRNILIESCIADSLSLINIASARYVHRAQSIYWQTGKRIISKAQDYSQRNDRIGKLLVQYFHILVMIANVQLEDSAVQILRSLGKNNSWIIKILHTTLSLRLARDNHKREEFHSLLAILNLLNNEVKNSCISSIATVEAGPEIVMSFDSFNEPNSIVGWLRHILEAISSLRAKGENDSYVREWLNMRLYFTGKQADQSTFNQWLTETEFRTTTLEARIEYRNNNLDTAQIKFEHALKLLHTLNYEDYNNSLLIRVDIERIKFIGGEPNNLEAFQKIWNDAKSKRHYISQVTLSKILRNYVQFLAGGEILELMDSFGEYLALDTKSLCATYHKLLSTASSSDKSSSEIKFINSLKKYALEIAPQPVIIASKYAQNNIGDNEAFKSCSLLATPEEKSLCNNLLLAIKKKKAVEGDGFRFLFHKSHVYSILKYPEFILAGFSLLQQSSGVVLLMSYALTRNDTKMIRELVQHGKAMFKVPIFTSLINSLLEALDESGIESEQFKDSLKKLVFTVLV